MRFQISTPAAVASVRGTEFRVVSGDNGNQMRGEVTEGLVAVSAQGQQQDIPKGFGVKAARGEAPKEPRKLLPAPVFQTDLSRVNPPVEFDWANVPGAVSYQLDVYTDDSLTLLHSARLGSRRAQIADLALGCYQVRLRAIDNVGFNGLDNASRLCVEQGLAAPVMDWDLSLGKWGWRVHWPEVEGASEYRVQIAEDKKFQKIISEQSVTDPALFLKSISQTQYVRVVAVDQQGLQSPHSNVLDFGNIWHDVAATTVYGLLIVVAL